MPTAPKNVWQALGFAWELGFIIALPLVLLGSGGKYLDSRWGTEPWLTLAGIFLAMVTSSVWVYRHAKSLVG